VDINGNIKINIKQIAMQNLFTVKVRYQKINDEGKEKKVNESYLIDAVSFTEAETRANKELEQLVRGEFMIVSIVRSNYSEIFTDFDGDIWWKAKVKHASIDEKSGKERTVSNYILIQADNVDHAYKNIFGSMKGMTIDFSIEGISDSKIMDFYPYFKKEDQ
jgi:hypothetical protein